MLSITTFHSVLANRAPSHHSLNLILRRVSEGHGFGTVCWLVWAREGLFLLSRFSLHGHFSGTSVHVLVAVAWQSVGLKVTS